MRRFLVPVVMLVLLVGCSATEQPPQVTYEEFREFQDHSPLGSETAEEMKRFAATDRGKDIVSRRLRQLFSDRGIAILRGATSVETFRIVDPQMHPNEGGFRHIEGYPIIATGPQQGAAFATRLAEAVLDGTKYFFSFNCHHDPAVAFRAWKTEESVTITVCPGCNGLEVYVRDSWGGRVHRGVGCHYDPLLAPVELVRLARESFPKDPLIQKLSDETTPMIPLGPAPEPVDR